MCALSRVWLRATPWTIARQAALPMGFPSKDTGVGCHFLRSSGSSWARDQTHNSVSPASAGGFFTTSAILEKAMAPHSSTLDWKIPWMEEPGRLQSVGSLRVRHDWATSLSLFTFMHWRRKWQPIPVFLPGESQRWGSLVGCRLWGHTESDTTEVT